MTTHWQRIYADLDGPGLAWALRGWVAWRREQLAAHPAHADRIAGIYDAATAYLRAEAMRRLAPPPIGRRMTTAALLARHGDRLTPAGHERWRCVCPWHPDQRPSLMVYADGHCHCFACGTHRPVADLTAAWSREVVA